MNFDVSHSPWDLLNGCDGQHVFLAQQGQWGLQKLAAGNGSVVANVGSGRRGARVPVSSEEERIDSGLGVVVHAEVL